MKNSIKKIISVVLATLTIITTFSCVSIGASAANNYAVRTVNDGTYTIKSYGSGKYVNTYAGSDYDGNKVTLWSFDSTTDERYNLKYIGNGKYLLYAYSSSKGTNRVVDIYRGNNKKIASGMKVDIWTPSKSEAFAQEFYIQKVSNGYVLRVASNTSLCLTVNQNKNGSQLLVKTYNSSNKNQIWQFCNTKGNVVNATYTASAKETAKEKYNINGTSYTHWVSSSSDTWKNTSTGKVASSATIKKLNNMVVAKAMLNKSLLNDYIDLASSYKKLYVNNIATTKMGNIIGKGSAALISLTVAPELALGDLALDIWGLDSDLAKEGSLLMLVCTYCNNMSASANKALSGCNSTDCTTVMNAYNEMAKASGCFYALKELCGSTINDMASRTTQKALLKLAVDIKDGLKDFALDKCIDRIHFGVSNAVSMAELAKTTGVQKIYDAKITQYKNLIK